MWIKICGNTNLEDARTAVEYGANALGFVFASSPRQVTEIQVRRIVSRLPQQVETYGVFVDADFAGIVRIVTACELTGVQLHGSSPAALPGRLREHFAGLGRKVSILHIVHRAAIRNPVGSAEQGEAMDFDWELARCGGDPAVDAVLVDSFTGKVAGGTGTSFDWADARASFLRAAPKIRLVVAGGLNPENVKLAISTLRPWGVDVVSGVEAAPGKKDHARVRAFIQMAREAGAELIGHAAMPGIRDL